MLGPVDYGLWIVGFILQVVAVVSIVRAQAVSRHFTLFIYIVAACVLSAGRYLVFSHYGLTSDQYI